MSATEETVKDIVVKIVHCDREILKPEATFQDMKADCLGSRTLACFVVCNIEDHGRKSTNVIHIGSAGSTSSVIVSSCPDYGIRSRQSNRASKIIICVAVPGIQRGGLGHISPAVSRFLEEVGFPG